MILNGILALHNRSRKNLQTKLGGCDLYKLKVLRKDSNTPTDRATSPQPQLVILSAKPAQQKKVKRTGLELVYKIE